MDGTAIGFPLVVIWLAVGNGENVTIGEVVVIGLTATLASMGAAPIPAAGLVLLVLAGAPKPKIDSSS